MPKPFINEINCTMVRCKFSFLSGAVFPESFVLVGWDI
jgi:hypothetical protein